MFDTLRADVRAARERDPAARSTLEVVLCYPGVHAVWGHRVAHRMWGRGARTSARLVSAIVRMLTGIEIHPAAVIGPRLFIDHGTGVVIGETAELGSDVTLYHGVTLGGVDLMPTKRHPTIGDRVILGAGAKVLGPVCVGHDSRIGANAVVVKDVPPNSVVVGVPGQVIARSRPREPDAPLDRHDDLLPDLVGASLQSLLQRVDHLEEATGVSSAPQARPSPEGVWAGEDFSI